MAAHTYRTWLWHQVGFATWNAQWYGGHHMAGYSLLYPPLAAVLGTRLVGVVAAVAAVGLFAMLARRMAPTPGAGALAAWLFLGGVMSNVVIGRMPFTLGIALAVGAWACARRSRVAAARRSRSPACGRARWRACSCASPPWRCSPARGCARDSERADVAHRARARRAGGRRRPADGGAVPRGRLGPLHGHRVLADAARLPRRAHAGRPVAAHGDLGVRDLRGGARRRVRDPELARPERAAARASCSARRCSCCSPGRARRARRSW